MIPYKPYVRGKHVESILGTCKNMTKKSIQLGDVSCPAFEFIYVYFSVALFMCFRPCPNG